MYWLFLRMTVCVCTCVHVHVSIYVLNFSYRQFSSPQMTQYLNWSLKMMSHFAVCWLRVSSVLKIIMWKDQLLPTMAWVHITVLLESALGSVLFFSVLSHSSLFLVFMEKLYSYIHNYIRTYILCFPLNQNLVRVITGCGISNTIIYNKNKNMKYTLQNILSVLHIVFTCYKKNSLHTASNLIMSHFWIS